MKNIYIKIFIVFIILIGNTILGDEIHLKDGRIIEGKIKNFGKVYIEVITSDNTLISIERNRISLIKIGEGEVKKTEKSHRERKTVQESDNYSKGYLSGKKYAEKVGVGGWGSAGCIGGFVLNFIGGGIVYLVSQTSSVVVPLEATQGHTYQYQKGFEKGYTQTIKEKRAGDIITGALIGIVFDVVIWFEISRH